MEPAGTLLGADDGVAMRRFTSGRAPRLGPPGMQKVNPILGQPISSPAWTKGTKWRTRSMALENIDPLKHERNVENHADDPEFLRALDMAKQAAELLRSQDHAKIDGLSLSMQAMRDGETDSDMESPASTDERPDPVPPRPPRRLTGMPPPPPPLSPRSSPRAPPAEAALSMLSASGTAYEAQFAALAVLERDSLSGPPSPIKGTPVSLPAYSPAPSASPSFLASLTRIGGLPDGAGGPSASELPHDEWTQERADRVSRDDETKEAARRSAVEWLSSACDEAAVADDWATHLSTGKPYEPRSTYVPPSRRPHQRWSARGLPRLSRAGGGEAAASVCAAELPRPTRRIRSSWSRRNRFASSVGLAAVGEGSPAQGVPVHGDVWVEGEDQAPPPLTPPPPPPRRAHPPPSHDQLSSTHSPKPTGEGAREEAMRHVPSNMMLELMLPPPGMPPPPPPRRRRRETQHWL